MHTHHLETERLILRMPTMGDVPRIHEYCSDYDIARNTLTMPYPYPESAAIEFVEFLTQNDDPYNCVFAIELKGDALIGLCGIHGVEKYHHAELGYWIGKPHWNNGYASEAVHRLVQFGFEVLNLNRIYARHWVKNPASRRVMEKAGMVYEGTMRQHYLRFGEYHDVGTCGILRSEWQTSK